MTVVFYLDAAVVLLTPLYVRIARRHGDDPVALAFIPVLLALLASTVLPVSNLTNLVVAARLDVGLADFVREVAPASDAAVVVGWFAYRRAFAAPRRPIAVDEGVDRRALLVGGPVVAWLLAGFTLGEQLGVPAWAVAATALGGVAAATGQLPWRRVPVGPIVLVLALGTLAVAAAPSLSTARLLAIDGRPGEAAVFAAAAVGANVFNNLPALVVALPSLELHPDRTGALLLGLNLGPVLWVTGALSTLLWQSTMARLGHPISARRFAAIGWRVGLPAMAAALAVRLAIAG